MSEYHDISDKDISLTPLEVIRSLGRFDMDVCGLKSHPTASRVVQLPEDGLAVAWKGRVWCNPPYSNPKPWMVKMANHKNGIALVLASTGTEWFQKYCFGAHSVFFLAKRPRFTRLDGSRFHIMRDCVLVGFSEADTLSFKKSGLAGVVMECGPTSQEDDSWA